MSEILLAEIFEARRRMGAHVRRTPLLYSPWLSDRSGADVWLKLENQQPTGSFKVRGALHKIGRLSAAEKARGIVAASAGNHALGIAHAVQALGAVQANIFVPQTAPAAKVDKLRRYPVTVHLGGDTYEAAHAAADDFRAQTGGVAVSAYDDVDVIAGQGTVGLEIVQERPLIDAIFVPVGGGGLLAGITTVARQVRRECRVVGMQPQASPAAQLSFVQGAAIDPYDHEPTIADGLAGGFGRTPFAVLQADPPQIVLADEREIRHAIYGLLHQHQLVVEPSGAIAIVPLLCGDGAWRGQTVVCVLSGGNLDTALLRAILDEFGGADSNEK